MGEPDWELAGEAVRRAIDSLGLDTEQQVAERLGLDTDTIRKIVRNLYIRGPQRSTTRKLDEALIAAGAKGWYPNRTREIAFGGDREFSLYALTKDEYQRLRKMRSQGDSK